MQKNIKQHYALAAVFLLVVTTLSACGFHLRGALVLSPELSPIYLQENSSYELARKVKALLLGNRIELVSVPAQAKSSIILLGDTKSRRILSVDSRGRAHEYLLTYTVTVAFKGKDFKEIKRRIVLTRTLLFDPNAVLGATNESADLYLDMQRDAARRILLKLEALSAQTERAPAQHNNNGHSSKGATAL